MQCIDDSIHSAMSRIYLPDRRRYKTDLSITTQAGDTLLITLQRFNERETTGGVTATLLFPRDGRWFVENEYVLYYDSIDSPHTHKTLTEQERGVIEQRLSAWAREAVALYYRDGREMQELGFLRRQPIRMSTRLSGAFYIRTLLCGDMMLDLAIRQFVIDDCTLLSKAEETAYVNREGMLSLYVIHVQLNAEIYHSEYYVVEGATCRQALARFLSGHHLDYKGLDIAKVTPRLPVDLIDVAVKGGGDD